ncbi:helix-turn-helix domain-containing protein [Streptomyces sp. NPDC012693]|uniref:helix-turn-helix domain-containing protein n=1 Tax=Streptomyces sp. NPDC012693 TaxID=3364844 RepID=UPI0036AFDAE8
MEQTTPIGRPLSAPLRKQLAALLDAGASNRAIARELGIDRNTAARYRTSLGVPVAPTPEPANRCTLTPAQKFAQFVRPLDGGHLEWTGRRTSSSGTPVLTINGRTVTARSTGYRIAHNDRAPKGYVTAECDYEGCVAPEHLQDEPGRTRLRAQLAALTGQESHLTECARGHAAAEHRRYGPDGFPYCGTCQNENKRAQRAAA